MNSSHNEIPDRGSVPEVDEKVSAVTTPRPNNWFLFWMLAPSALSLLYFLIYQFMGSISEVAEIGSYVSLAASLIGAIYCAVWTAREISREKGARILVGLFFAAVFFVVNLIISFLGCSPHIQL